MDICTELGDLEMGHGIGETLCCECMLTYILSTAVPRRQGKSNYSIHCNWNGLCRDVLSKGSLY